MNNLSSFIRFLLHFYWFIIQFVLYEISFMFTRSCSWILRESCRLNKLIFWFCAFCFCFGFQKYFHQAFSHEFKKISIKCAVTSAHQYLPYQYLHSLHIFSSHPHQTITNSSFNIIKINFADGGQVIVPFISCL